MTTNGDDGGPGDGAGPGAGPRVTWQAILRRERQRVGLTQAELGERAGLDGETIRAYEGGRRQPTRESLEVILEVLQVSYGTAHAAMLDRGFHHPEFRYATEPAPGFYFSVEEIRAYVEQMPWPMFTGNELGETSIANRLAQTLWDIDLEAELALRSRASANLFVAMAERRIFERLVNWDELLATFVALYKKVPASRTMLDNPGALFGDIIAAFASANPSALGRLEEIWRTTPPREDKVRWHYPVVWREPGFPDIRFTGIVTQASETLSVGFNEWIPSDAASWAAFEGVLASRGVRAGSAGWVAAGRGAWGRGRGLR